MDELDKLLNLKEPEEIADIVKEVMEENGFDVHKEMVERFPYTRKVSINDIVPEEYQQKLMQIDITMSKCYWVIGDIADDLINSVNREKAKMFGKVICQNDIYEAVGYFCHRTIRSIRYYWEIAHYFPQEIREKYDVPFVMFAEARWVKDWELLLKIASENPTWSSEHVRGEYYRLVDENLPVLAHHIGENGENLPVLLSQDGEATEPVREWRGHNSGNLLVNKLEHTVGDLRDIVNKIPLREDIKARIRDVILEIDDISALVRDNVV